MPSPAASVALARAIIGETDSYKRTVAAGRVALEWLARVQREKQLALSVTEQRWIDRLRREFDRLPTDAEQMRRAADVRYGTLYEPAEYGIET